NVRREAARGSLETIASLPGEGTVRVRDAATFGLLPIQRDAMTNDQHVHGGELRINRARRQVGATTFSAAASLSAAVLVVRFVTISGPGRPSGAPPPSGESPPWDRSARSPPRRTAGGSPLPRRAGRARA